MKEIGVEVKADFLKGDKGDPTATIEINEVLTGEPGTNATIDNIGTDVNMKLNITIPRGDTGEQGPQGEQGIQGVQGLKGDTGEIGTPIPYDGTFEELKNSEVDKKYNYIILNSSDTVYEGHWVYYDRNSSEWKDGGIYLAQELTQEVKEKLEGLEQKYEEQNTEIVDARGEHDLLRDRLDANDLVVQQNIAKQNTLEQKSEEHDIKLNNLETRVASKVEYIFNPQYPLDDSNFILTTDTEAVSSKTYYIKTSDGYYVPNQLITTFETGVTYYEKSSTYSALSGECMIVKAYGKVIMIDTGGANKQDSIKQHLQANNITKVDYLFISHYHSDHIGNFINLCDYIDFSNCKCYLPLVAPASDWDKKIYDSFIAKINELNLECIYPDELNTLTIEDLKITFYNCGQEAFDEIQSLGSQKVNDYSMLCLFNHFNTNVLFSGDIERFAEERLTNHKFFENIKIDLYKWHHHGVNPIGNCYKDYLKMIAPINSVVLCGEMEKKCNDPLLLNIDRKDYVYKRQVVYTSNGFDVKINKDNSTLEIEDFKNIQIHDNDMNINEYTHFMKVKFNVNWRSLNLTFAISDQQTMYYSGLFNINIRIRGHMKDNLIEITNLSTTGTSEGLCFNYLDGIYVAYDSEYFYIGYKKPNDKNSTLTLTLLNSNIKNSGVILEYMSNGKLTEEEFISIYGENYVIHQEWKELEYNTSLFAPYYEGAKLYYRKVGALVELNGALKNLSEFNTETKIATLPERYRPKYGICRVCQGSSGNRFCLEVKSNGNITMSRYGKSDTNEMVPVGAWLRISTIFTI